jgi:hypothetical protein
VTYCSSPLPPYSLRVAEDEVVPRVGQHDPRHLANLVRLGLGLASVLGSVLGPGPGLGSGGQGTGVAEVPSSNCFCISPGPKRPRSPPFLYEPQSLRSVEYLEKTCSVGVRERVGLG